MNKTIEVMGTEIALKEYNGQRVVTFKDIDVVHKRSEGTAKRNFQTNTNRFIEGIDYFRVSPDEIRTNKIMDISPKAHKSIILITESGYLMLIKSFTDDLSWQVQRCLVNTYFKAKDAVSRENPCAYAQAKDRIALWKRKVSNPLIERLILLTDAEDFIAAYTLVYKSMRKSYGFDMNKAKFDYCRKYNADYENCSVIDCVADNGELRKAFEECAIRQLSNDRLERTKRVAERKICEAERFVSCSEEAIQKAEQLANTFSSQLDISDREYNCSLK